MTYYEFTCIIGHQTYWVRAADGKYGKLRPVECFWYQEVFLIGVEPTEPSVRYLIECYPPGVLDGVTAPQDEHSDWREYDGP